MNFNNSSTGKNQNLNKVQNKYDCVPKMKPHLRYY